MAREHARILCSIWQPDSDFRARSPEAQRLYFVLLSQRELNNAGVMPVMVSKWARHSASTTVEDIEKALGELAEHRYVVLDRDTEELFVRSFMRNDGTLKHPYTRRSALRSAEQIESRALRREAARELVRIGHPEAVETALRLDPDATSTTHRDAIPATTQQPDATPTEQPDPTPSIPRRGWGGEGEGGGVTSEGGSVGGSRVRAQGPPSQDRPAEQCAKHAGTDFDGPCRRCGDARAAAEQWDRDTDRARRVAIRACDWCDGDGWRIDPRNRHRGPLTPGRRCDHTPLTPEQLEAIA